MTNFDKKKTIVISEGLHQRVKIFCAQNSLKLNDWVEKELEKSLKDMDRTLNHTQDITYKESSPPKPLPPQTRYIKEGKEPPMPKIY